MHIQIRELRLQDFRCHAKAVWQFPSGITVIHGDNGCGKTSILEAIALMALGRSFRQGKDPSLTRWQCEQFSIEGSWQRYGPLRIQLQGRRNQLRASMQGQRVSLRRELTELLPLVIDAPQGRPLVTGINADRRRWLDALTMTCEPGAQTFHQSYLRALMQRSRLLRHSCHTDELSAREMQLVSYGSRWRQVRRALCQQINQALAEEEALTEGSLKLQVDESAPEEIEEWQQRLHANREDDRRLGRCRIGPHADTLHILWQGHEIRRVGSRGQQRLVALALRLAECRVREQARGAWPLLLLDDALEALDRGRQQQALLRLQSCPGQTLISTPELPSSLTHIPAHTIAV